MNNTQRLVWLALALCTACRVERDPALSPFASDASAIQGERDAPDDPAGSGGTPGSGGAAGVVAAGTGGIVSAGAGGGGNGGAGGGSGISASGTGGAAGGPIDTDASVRSDAGGGDSCDPDVLVCNPVTNEGCPPPMQCSVDLLADVLTGYCIFNGPVAGGCFNSGVTESCPPSETCFEFECRTLCFCDDDCKEGQCCVDPVGTLGFKVCGEC